ncbi:hypothetical protein AQ962_03615 [Burkholderia pseudomallei]|uniref:hypothetical protein n=1 Tax=Burkholderia pseudomallei TaxID=28450 RepID=UPI000977EB1E|nr:hypothetical protein [Burkholderia pseudomallei]OMW13632.1 hypothetical protein AQ804_29950 [Burkholderia pseudomallei]OMW19963.1 hypothetical protein AQ805_02880 [Burkholderia pseudomallei]ONF14192.1 hypothetical protein AQ962_03615 [Burkholderia pseudomallei]ONF14264.1 hypothetical protein AQ961_22050 [Burkholderia pseudomallei]ONF19252.1 hypothetical protein AQ963_29380 [Burkholderia pseudomallei]
MAICNFTISPVDGLPRRAGDELHAAADALLRANAQLVVIKKAIESGDLDRFCAFSLVETALELTGTYAERAENEADFFTAMAEVCHG